MKRLLMLLPSVPARLDSGAKIRNAGLLKLLGADHEVDAVAFGSLADDAGLAKLAKRTIVVPAVRGRPLTRRVIDMARTELPDMALRLWSPALMRAVECLARDGEYDAVQAEGIEMTPYVEVVPPRQRIYDAHNAEFLLQRRLADSGSPLARAYSRLQWRRLERFEREVVRKSRLTLAVSRHDANQLLALAGPGADIRVVPNGIDTAAVPFRAPAEAAAPNLLFLGKLDFRPNAEAVRWLVDEVLPHLPEATLFAVGASPPRWLVEAGQHYPRIAVTGYVDDERPYVERCAALVLPVRTGGGSRLKALTAMASGLPIVATRLGMEGLDGEPETHYLVADSPSEWIASLRRVVTDARLRQHLASNARNLVEQRYDWSALRTEVQAAYACL